MLFTVSDVWADFTLTLSGYVSVKVADSGNVVLPLSRLGRISASDTEQQNLPMIELTSQMVSDGFVSKSDVSNLLHEWNGKNPQEAVRVHGPDIVRIYGYSEEISYLSVVSMAKSMVEKTLEIEGFAVSTVTPLSSKGQNIRISDANAIVSIRPVELRYPFNRLCVWADVVSANGSMIKSEPVWFRVKAEKKVLVASRDVKVGESGLGIAFEAEYKDVSTLSGPPLETGRQLEGIEIIEPLPEGQVISRDKVRIIPPVRQGETVLIETVAGTVYLKSRAVALQDGLVGSQIRLRSISSGEEMRGTVLSHGRVFVEGDS
ncbi:flagellar basal body P-ring formation chaperone FlgA [Hahella ganghwensis]|uniref:flagellar basal body P-ring formation chaperone FlgA n=1 Tax=Hahella ganghwensis TaxID=286420 RepID=UPI000362E59A|nr:flagellar basal body P-ring formation chaperone FlgA [Hahella ganghwensis]